MRRITSLVALSLACGLLITACGGGGNASLTQGDVAVVGGQAVTKADFQLAMDRVKKSYAARKTAFPKLGTPQYESLKGQVVTYLVQRAELAQKASDLGVHVSDKQINQRIDELKKGPPYNGNEKKFKQALTQQGLTEETLRNDIKYQLTAQQLFDKVTTNAKVSDKAIADYYNAHKVDFQTRRVRHILVNTKSLADRLYAQLVAAHEKNFTTLAKKYSKDPSSAPLGGCLTATRGKLVPQFASVAFSLKTGELSKPVKSPFGWHIIQALAPIKTPPLSDVKNDIRAQLLGPQKNKVVTDWITGVQKDFCKPGKIKYQAGYQPTPDPCASINATTGGATVTT